MGDPQPMLKFSHLNVMGHDLHQLHTPSGRVSASRTARGPIQRFDPPLSSLPRRLSRPDAPSSRSYSPSPRSLASSASLQLSLPRCDNHKRACSGRAAFQDPPPLRDLTAPAALLAQEFRLGKYPKQLTVAPEVLNTLKALGVPEEGTGGHMHGVSLLSVDTVESLLVARRRCGPRIGKGLAGAFFPLRASLAPRFMHRRQP